MEEPHAYQFVIDVLIGVIGILVGVGLAHVWILRKLNSLVVTVARYEERMTTLFNMNIERKAENTATVEMHKETLGAIRDLINQNTRLMAWRQPQKD